MTFRIRYTRGARDDLKQLHERQVARDSAAAARALDATRDALALLAACPFACRRADDADPFLRELVISFADGGYVVLFDIEGVRPAAGVAADSASRYVAILAVRPLYDDDYL